ncbi:GBS Bsp-like repeat-containing protein, partial [Streptococcus suis]|uniref:GBS Bsp-like repeat-containing protein n=1 Tax=Streptococcus suis TaxID=1307 RepID=UPI0015D4732E
MKKNIRLYSKTLLTVPIVVATLSGGLVHADGVETPSSTNNLIATTENMETVVEKTESQKLVSSVESITSTSTSDSAVSGIIDKNSSTSSSEIINAVSETENATVSASISSTLGTANSLTNNQTTNEVTKTVSETENATVSAFATSTLQTASSSATNPTPKQDIVSIQQREQMLVVKYNLPISSEEVIKFAVWSDKHSQDDIIWYSANQTGAAYVELKKHKDYGLYHIHTYSDRAGRFIAVDAKTIVVPAPKPVTAKASMKTASRFEVTIMDVPSHFSSVSVPIWSENKGQDDIIWYTAQKRTDGSYGLLVDTQKHKTDTGTYHIHVYGQNSQTGTLDGLSATTLTVPAPKPVTAKASMKTASRFEVTITDVPSHISSVSVPIWSE